MQSFKYNEIRDLGDIITDTFQYLRIHFKTLGKSLFYFVLPLYIIQFFLMKGYTDQMLSALTGNDLANFETIFGLQYIIGIALSLIASATLTVITIKHLKLTENNIEPTPEAILKEIVPSILKFVGLYIVYYSILFFSALLFLFPMIFFGIKFCLSISALLLEEETVFGALNRSWELTKDHWWGTFAVILVMSILLGFITYAFIIPTTILTSLTVETGAGEIGDSTFWMNFYYVITGILTAISSLTSILLFIAISLQYYNLAERKEGGNLRSQIEGLLN